MVLDFGCFDEPVDVGVYIAQTAKVESLVNGHAFPEAFCLLLSYEARLTSGFEGCSICDLVKHIVPHRPSICR